MAIRLKDIAADLGVSTVTVSKVLRGHPDIGERTRALVLQRMKEMNYRPNMLARGWRVAVGRGGLGGARPGASVLWGVCARGGWGAAREPGGRW